MSSERDHSHSSSHHHHHHHSSSSDEIPEPKKKKGVFERRYLPSVKKRKKIERVLFTILTIVSIFIFLMLAHVTYFDIK